MYNNHNEILSNVAHRTWSYPDTQWIWYQEWNNALFLHYEIDQKILQSIIPNHLELDTYKGAAWISAVAFKMESIKPRKLPAISPISYFLEINVRTYVIYNGMPGVYFLDIKANNKLSCFLAKHISGLPYEFSDIIYNSNKLKSKNLYAEFKVQSSIDTKSELDIWLTERYSLYNTNSSNDLFRYEIHHMPWELYNVDIKDVKTESKNTLLQSLALPTVAHYSPGVKVLAWKAEKLVKSK